MARLHVIGLLVLVLAGAASAALSSDAQQTIEDIRSQDRQTFDGSEVSTQFDVTNVAYIQGVLWFLLPGVILAIITFLSFIIIPCFRLCGMCQYGKPVSSGLLTGSRIGNIILVLAAIAGVVLMAIATANIGQTVIDAFDTFLTSMTELSNEAAQIVTDLGNLGTVQSGTDDISTSLNDALSTTTDAQEFAKQFRVGLDVTVGILAAIACIVLLLTVVASFIGFKLLLIIFLLVGTAYVPVTWIVFGAVSSVRVLTADMCVEMTTFIGEIKGGNSNSNNPVSQILSCADPTKAGGARNTANQGVTDQVTAVNAQIDTWQAAGQAAGVSKLAITAADLNDPTQLAGVKTQLETTRTQVQAANLGTAGDTTVANLNKAISYVDIIGRINTLLDCARITNVLETAQVSLCDDTLSSTTLGFIGIGLFVSASTVIMWLILIVGLWVWDKANWTGDKPVEAAPVATKDSQVKDSAASSGKVDDYTYGSYYSQGDNYYSYSY